jgi:signal transduction histidine kinase/ActR/RegA family two-component response regulator
MSPSLARHEDAVLSGSTMDTARRHWRSLRSAGTRLLGLATTGGQRARCAPSGLPARAARALRAARAIAWECDLATGTIRHELAAEVLGAPLPGEPLSLKQALRFVHREDRRALLARVRAAVSLREPFVHHFRIGAGRADATLWMENHAEVVCDAGGHPLRLGGALIDITAHRRALDALAVADRRKDAFIATLAHELRNPLTAIATATHLLRDPRLGATQVHGCIEMIRRQAAHLAHLVDDLLDVSRVIRDRLELKRERIDLNTVVATALEATADLIKARRHELEVSLPQGRVELDGDHVRLTQLCGNLLTNAAKYTPNGGRVAVIVESDPRWATLRVRDSGIGIAAETLPHLFELFYQVDSSLSHSSGGLGIGLALVQRIAQLHGGSVTVHSEGVGRGSEFVVRLPLAAPAAEADDAGRLQQPAPIRTDRPLRILVADDNADVAEAMALTLRMCGHEVAVALDGDEALRLADELRPQVALLDVGMPKREGHEVAREIRRRGWSVECRTLLIALTGWNAPDLEGRADLSPFDTRIVKPTDIEVINGLIERARERARDRWN